MKELKKLTRTGQTRPTITSQSQEEEERFADSSIVSPESRRREVDRFVNRATRPDRPLEEDRQTLTGQSQEEEELANSSIVSPESRRRGVDQFVNRANRPDRPDRPLEEDRQTLKRRRRRHLTSLETLFLQNPGNGSVSNCRGLSGLLRSAVVWATVYACCPGGPCAVWVSRCGLGSMRCLGPGVGRVSRFGQTGSVAH